MTESLVIDATCAVLLVVPGPSQSRYEELFGGWKRAGYDLYAPGLWIYEVTSALCKAVHFGGLTAAEAERCLTQALNLGVCLVAPDKERVQAAFAWTVRLHRAAAYDSGCLRQRLPAAALPGAGRVSGVRAVDGGQAAVECGRSAVGAICGVESKARARNRGSGRTPVSQANRKRQSMKAGNQLEAEPKGQRSDLPT